MPKWRFSLLDVVASRASLGEALQGYRVNNIYDVNDKTYLFKMHRTQGEGGGKKVLLLESGVRFHLTAFTRDKSDTPSPFTMKLRKHVRGRRLVNIRQLGMDRVVCFTFGQNEAAYHLVLELYDKGNVVLCNHAYEIVALLRSSQHLDEVNRVENKRVYPRFRELAAQQQQGKEMNAGGSAEVASADAETAVETETAAPDNDDAAQFVQWVETHLVGPDVAAGADTASTAAKPPPKKWKGKKKNKGPKVMTLKQALCRRGAPCDVDRYGPDIVEHCLLMAGLNPGTKIDEALLGRLLNEKAGEKTGDTLFQILRREPESVLAGLCAASTPAVSSNISDDGAKDTAPPKGYLLCKRLPQGDGAAVAAGAASIASIANSVSGGAAIGETKHKQAEDNGNGLLMYTGFSPVLLKQHARIMENEKDHCDDGKKSNDKSTTTILPFDTFESAVDEYFARIETQRAQRRHNQAAKAVQSKLEKMKTQQAARLAELENEQASLADHAAAIETHATLVQNATLVVNSMIAGGMEWDALWQMVTEEKRNGNPVASVISRLDLEHNSMTLLLPKLGEEAEEDDGSISSDSGSSSDEDVMSSSESEIDVEGSSNKDMKTSNKRKKNKGAKKPATLCVKIDLSLSAYQNARAYYEKVKKTKDKTVKAAEAGVRATKEAQKKTLKQIEKQKIKVSQTIIREVSGRSGPRLVLLSCVLVPSSLKRLFC